MGKWSEHWPGGGLSQCVTLGVCDNHIGTVHPAPRAQETGEVTSEEGWEETGSPVTVDKMIQGKDPTYGALGPNK